MDQRINIFMYSLLVWCIYLHNYNYTDLKKWWYSFFLFHNIHSLPNPSAFEVLGIEPRASHMLGKPFTPELHLKPTFALYVCCSLSRHRVHSLISALLIHLIVVLSFSLLAELWASGALVVPLYEDAAILKHCGNAEGTCWTEPTAWTLTLAHALSLTPMKLLRCSVYW